MAPPFAVGDLRWMRRARDIWVGIIQQFERSGLTQEAFAAERGIPVGTLRSWIYKLRQEGEDAAALLPVRVIPSPAPTARRPEAETTSAVEVEVGDLVRVRLPAGTPP